MSPICHLACFTIAPSSRQLLANGSLHAQRTDEPGQLHHPDLPPRPAEPTDGRWDGGAGRREAEDELHGLRGAADDFEGSARPDPAEGAIG